MLRTICSLLAAMFAVSATAQQASRPDPADPKAPSAGRTHESAFKDYRPYADPAVGRWREANEQAGRLGGHAGHLPASAKGNAKPETKGNALGGHGSHK